MRGARMMGGLAGLVVAIGVLTGAGAASATPAFLPAGASFSMSSTTEQVFSITSTIKWRCNQAKFTGTTTNPASDTMSITATYGPATGVSGAWCRLYVGGTFSTTTVSPTAAWSMKAVTYLGGASTGSITTSGGTTFTTGTCVITLSSGTVLPFQGQDDVPSPAGPGLTLSVNASGIHYTSSGCSGWGIPATGTTMTTTGSSYDASTYVG